VTNEVESTVYGTEAVILDQADMIENEMRLAVEGWETEGGAQDFERDELNHDNSMREAGPRLRGEVSAMSESESY
jgi:hypothetical protein